MKKFTILAMFIIASFLTKAQPTIDVRSLAISETHDCCQGATVYVSNIKLENLSGSDSAKAELIHYGTYNNTSNTIDSVIFMDSVGTTLVTKARVTNGNCDVILNKYVKKNRPMYFKVFVKSTLTGLGWASLNLMYVQHPNGADWLSSYIQIPNLNVFDCANPTNFSINFSVNNPQGWQKIKNGDTVLYSPNPVSFNLNYGYNYQTKSIDYEVNDSLVYTYDMTNNLFPTINYRLGKMKIKVLVHGSANDFGSDSISFFVIPNKIATKILNIKEGDTIANTKAFTNLWLSIPSYAYNIPNVEWNLDDSLVYSYSNQNPNATMAPPSIDLSKLGTHKLKLLVYGELQDFGSDSVVFTVVQNKIPCKIQGILKNDTLCNLKSFNQLWLNVVYNGSDIEKIVWSMNDSDLYIVNPKVNPNANYFPESIDLSIGGPKKLKVKIYGQLQDYGSDSVEFFVKVRPKMKITVSKTNICTGDFSIIDIDTAGASTVYYNGSPTKKTQFLVKTEGQYWFTFVWRMGCQSDTSLPFYEYPAVDVPIISSKDCKIWVSVSNADSYVWYDHYVPIANSDTDIISATKAGLYSVEVFNKFGCSKKSATIWVDCNAKSGINLNNKIGSMQIYPTTVESDITIVSENKDDISIKDVNGKEVFHATISEGTNVISLVGLSPGVYFLGRAKIIKL